MENTDPRVEPWERLIFPLPVSSPSGNKLLRVVAGIRGDGVRVEQAGRAPGGEAQESAGGVPSSRQHLVLLYF